MLVDDVPFLIRVNAENILNVFSDASLPTVLYAFITDSAAQMERQHLDLVLSKQVKIKNRYAYVARQ